MRWNFATQTALRSIAFDDPAFDASLSYRVPAELRSVQPPPLPDVKAVPRWSPDPKQELITPWRTWNLESRSKTVDKQVAADGPAENAAGRRVLSVVGDFGPGSMLSYRFFPDPKLGPGRYRFACRVRGKVGQAVPFEVADGRRAIAQGTAIPLSPEWQEHVVEFALETSTADETTLRFILPKDAAGKFELIDTRLRNMNRPAP